MDYLPLCFDLRKQPCLLVGGGEVAERKAEALVRAGARVRAVAPHFSPTLKQLLEANDGEAREGCYESRFLDDVVLVIAATDDEALNRRVHADAEARRLPVNVVDNPPLCRFIFPSIVDRSPLLVAVSSSGQAPVLARLLRARLESLIPTSLGRLAALIGRFRGRAKQRFQRLSERRHFWEAVVQGPVAARVAAGRDAEAEAMLVGLMDAAAGDFEARDSAGNEASRQGAGKPVQGVVWLVGAGPGDPELLTFKALRRMQEADVVLYDRLVSEAVMRLCRVDAERIYVGKARADHSLPQGGINALLVQLARDGKRVLRLKGGDPFIFGRGGEELEHLRDAGVDFEVVPGITAASACSAAAGIPLTHRDHAQSVKFVTGQRHNRTRDIDFSELVPPHQTIVFYMGLHRLEILCREMVAHGKPGDTPAALVQEGGLPTQRVLTGTLANLPERNAEAGLEAPALLIVGEVVALHEQLAWFGDGAGESNNALMELI